MLENCQLQRRDITEAYDPLWAVCELRKIQRIEQARGAVAAARTKDDRGIAAHRGRELLSSGYIRL